MSQSMTAAYAPANAPGLQPPPNGELGTNLAAAAENLAGHITGFCMRSAPLAHGDPHLFFHIAGALGLGNLGQDGGNFMSYDSYPTKRRQGVPGALEQVLVGTRVRDDATAPIAVQHIVRAHNPCLAGTIH